MPDIKEFEDELRSLINRCSIDSLTETPDYILAQYLVRCTEAFGGATVVRDRWFGNQP